MKSSDLAKAWRDWKRCNPKNYKKFKDWERKNSIYTNGRIPDREITGLLSSDGEINKFELNRLESFGEPIPVDTFIERNIG